MFEVLASVLLILLISVLIYYVLVKVIPAKTLAIIGGLFILGVLFLSFWSPTYPPVAFLWGIISFPLKPLGFSILLLLLGVLQIKKDKIANPGPILLWTATMILLVSSNPLFSYQAAKTIEWEGVRLEQARKETYFANPDPAVIPVIVVLAKGTTEPSIPYRPQIQITRTGDRILYAAKLIRQQQMSFGNTPRLIICASPRSGFTGTPEQLNEARDAAILLQNIGVPPSRIILETQGQTLRQTALEVQTALTNLQLSEQPFYLVTSGIQNRRAIQTFRKLDLIALPRPTDFYTFQANATPNKKVQVQDLLPSVTALQMTNDVVEEYLLTIYYFLRGWLAPMVL